MVLQNFWCQYGRLRLFGIDVLFVPVLEFCALEDIDPHRTICGAAT